MNWLAVKLYGKRVYSIFYDKKNNEITKIHKVETFDAKVDSGAFKISQLWNIMMQ